MARCVVTWAIREATWRFDANNTNIDEFGLLTQDWCRNIFGPIQEVSAIAGWKNIRCKDWRGRSAGCELVHGTSDATTARARAAREKACLAALVGELALLAC